MIFCIIGKTGAGKTTIANKVSEKLNIPIIVTYTSRPKRDNEIEGKDYHYVDFDYFDEHANDFIEIREYKVANGEIWRYGTNVKDIKKDKDYITIVDVNGYKQLSNYYKTKAILIDSYDNIIKKRLANRGDDCEEMKRRLEDDKRKINEFLSEISVTQRYVIYNNENIKDAIDDCCNYINYKKFIAKDKIKRKRHSLIEKIILTLLGADIIFNIVEIILRIIN